MSEIQLLSSRQESLLRTLLFTTTPVSYKQISTQLKLSIRTIQREVSALKPILEDFNLKVLSKMGSGIMIDGNLEDKALLDKTMLKANTFQIYSPEERQEGMLFDLLIATEPIKYFLLSNKYGVTEATISNDLDKLESTCMRNNLTIIRKAGFGVLIHGLENDKRSALSKLLHKDITFEEWFELFQLSEQEEKTIESSQLNQSVCKRLRKFVETSNILKVEHAVKVVLDSQTVIELSDRSYVNLIVHLILAIERINHQVNYTSEDENILPEIETMEEYIVAKQIVQKLERILHISMPKNEISYITLHLFGANFSQQYNSSTSNNDNDIEWYDLTQSFIHAVEKELSISLKEDLSLFEGLLAHLVPSVNRLKLGLQIHNPMLKDIKQRYPDIFSACQKAGVTISTKVGKDIPEDEIGYLAVHIGASAIRMKEHTKQIYKAVIVCASGMGTSTYLASKVEKEIANLQIDSILSLTELKDKINNRLIDQIIISTVTLPFLHPDNYILVSPFLSDDEINLIYNKLGSFATKNEEVPNDNKEPNTVSMVGSARYGEGMVQILRNLSVFKLPASAANLKNVTEILSNTSIVINPKQVLLDLDRREKQGTFVLDNLAMVHAKTSGVSELLLAVFHFNDSTIWDGFEIQSLLLLAAPVDATKEHIEMISVISANLIEESFLHVLLKGAEEEIKIQVESLLSNAFFTKVKALLKEPSTK
jgi:mannitol operon transcriptional antiterminator